MIDHFDVTSVSLSISIFIFSQELQLELSVFVGTGILKLLFNNSYLLYVLSNYIFDVVSLCSVWLWVEKISE